MTPRNVGKKTWNRKMGNGEWGVGNGNSIFSPFPTPHSPLPTFRLVTARGLGRRGSTRPRTHARREMARGFAVSVRRASEASQKPLLQNLAPTVRPRDSRNHRVGSETFRFGDHICAPASDGDDQRSAHQNFVQCSENLSRHTLSIF